MAKIFIIGATGGVGHRLWPMLVEAGHEVAGLHRKPEQAEELKSAGIRPVEGDLMQITAKEMQAAIEGSDIVVFSAGAAGSGVERTSEIDGQGPVKLIEACKAAGISRAYLVSAFPEAGRGGELKEGFEHYMKVKKEADAALVASGLDWVILRPGTLLHEDGDGQVSAGLALTYGSVARGNVAAVLAELIDTPEICHELIELTDGDTPVAEAVKALIR
ncbi:SDR family oxidoreductase [Ponticaulis sp.]|uniref:SDR family oxidoreductase n=1 Tax=Ponticaulis sp. TaxID=2020902 RepID=UPI000B69BF1F|nr:SDR family oxidoreductase [Ponticaulis sp.]MAI90345.1 NAD-dependent dehydratase [Ponticaulis sp.]OUX99981.1 MAG: NAD-dependent dehydratase [Hyphomonadaceae bacterium TMED5]|tara:strand:+ start:317769 stop:318422 length:654 start_codon:yes stop_codon:yes gene_type:complete